MGDICVICKQSCYVECVGKGHYDVAIERIAELEADIKHLEETIGVVSKRSLYLDDTVGRLEGKLEKYQTLISGLKRGFRKSMPVMEHLIAEKMKEIGLVIPEKDQPTMKSLIDEDPEGYQEYMETR